MPRTRRAALLLAALALAPTPSRALDQTSPTPSRALESAPAPAVAPPTAPAAPATIEPRPWDPKEKAITKGAAAAKVAVPDFTTLPPAPPLDPGLVGSVRRVELPAGEKLVALTFDMCETAGEVAGYDGAVFDELRRRGVPATIFVGGHWAATHPARFREIAADPRFEIANHTWTHANLRLVDDERLAREILAPEAAFRDAGYEARSRFLRFPFGACDARSMKAVTDAGMAAIQWDVSTGDPSPLTSADAIVATTLHEVRPGSIVLAHANGRGFNTAKALPRILDRLAAQGYRFVTVGDLLTRGRPVITATCYDAKPGDTEKYDHWTAPGGRKPSTVPLPEPQAGSPGAPIPAPAATHAPAPRRPAPGAAPLTLRPGL